MATYKAPMRLNFTLNLGSVFKIGILGVLILTTLFVSCRKEIVHPIGTTTETEAEDPPVGGGTQDWVKITSTEITNVNAVQVFNGELYVGGEFENTAGTVKFLGKLDAQNNLIPALSGSFFFYGVYDLSVYNNDLIIGGNFSYVELALPTQYDLMHINSSGTTIATTFCDGISEQVRNLNEYNGGLFVGGAFNPSGSNGVTTSNADLLQSYTSVGLANTVGTIRSSTVHQSQLFVAGTDDDLLQWNGSTWNSFSYNNQFWSDEVFAVMSYNSEMYILGKFNNGINLKKMNLTGTWENVANVAQVGSMSSFTKMKVVNNELYICGSGLQINGSSASSVLKLDGTTWESVGNLSGEARDIEYFNGKLYVATTNGVYEY